MRGVGERSLGVACMSPIGAHPQRVVSPTKIHLIDKIPPLQSPTAHNEFLRVLYICVMCNATACHRTAPLAGTSRIILASVK